MKILENIKNMSGKTFVGIILLYLGLLLFVRDSGVYVAQWLTSWSLILLAGGIFTGIRSAFSKPGPYLMILFGTYFLAESILDEVGSVLDLPMFPVIIIAAGIYFMVRKPAVKAAHD